MAFKQLKNLHRSMFGQMLILTLVFLASSIYYIAVEPLQELNIDPQEPMSYTVQQIRGEMRSFIDNELKQKTPSATFHFSPNIERFLADKNPDFHYYILVNGRHYGNLTTPHYYHEMGFAALDSLNQQLSLPELCTGFMKDLDNASQYGYVQYNYCGPQQFYLEFSGVKAALTVDNESLFNFYRRNLWAMSKYLLFSASGVFLITAIILLFNLRTLKRLANLAQSFNPKKLDQKLPEKGLPYEVIPLVQAVNEMISRVDKTQQQHSFFLSTAAHEMRTPLTVFRTRLEMLDESPIKDKLIGDLRRLINLVNQLLRLMRVGGPKAVENEIDLVQCCHRVLRERALVAEEANVTLTFAAEVESFVVTGDEGLMEVAIANLVDNAVSFSQPDTCVDIRLNSDGRLSVRDYGPGIPADKLQSLFEPFAKFPPNRNGHGLGLAIVKAVAQLHSATVDAENVVSGGAQFNIRFT